MQASQLTQRLISALVMLAIVAVVLWLGTLAFKVMAVVLFTAMIAEWLRLLSKSNSWPVRPTFLASIGLSFVGFGVAVSLSTGYMVAVSMVVALALVLINQPRIQHSWMMMWPFYIGLAASLAVAIYLSYGASVLLWLLVILWATDIGAYFAGRSIGGPKLMPKVSPKKTWSGGIGGILAACGASVLFVSLVGVPSALVGAVSATLVVSLILSIVSQAGDFLESHAKRQHDTKDSSNLIPGHGGFLDRLDGLLSAVPVAFIFLTYLL